MKVKRGFDLPGKSNLLNKSDYMTVFIPAKVDKNEPCIQNHI